MVGSWVKLMPWKNQRSVTLPKDVVDEAESWLNENSEKLKRKGIKKISHVFERAWYYYHDNKPIE